MDPDFCEIGASGRLWTRAETIRELSSTGEWSQVELSELEGAVLADGLVLVRYLSVSNGRRARRSSLWRLSGDVWRIVFHQGTLA